MKISGKTRRMDSMKIDSNIRIIVDLVIRLKKESVEGMMASDEESRFIDRDGTINVDTGYLYESDKLEYIPGSPELIKNIMTRVT